MLIIKYSIPDAMFVLLTRDKNNQASIPVNRIS